MCIVFVSSFGTLGCEIFTCVFFTVHHPRTSSAQKSTFNAIRAHEPNNQYGFQRNIMRYLKLPLSAVFHQNTRSKATNYTTCHVVPSTDSSDCFAINQMTKSNFACQRQEKIVKRLKYLFRCQSAGCVCNDYVYVS